MISSHPGLELRSKKGGLFENGQPRQASPLLSEMLRRSSMRRGPMFSSLRERGDQYILPIMTELHRFSNSPIHFYLAEAFDKDKSKGFNGVCESLVVKKVTSTTLKPFIVIVEVNQYDFEHGKKGFPRCIDAMLAAQRYNADGHPVYGIIAFNSTWLTFSLKDTVVTQAMSLYMPLDTDKILGVLAGMVADPA